MAEQSKKLSRRQVVVGGTAAAAIVGLAACGGDEESTATTGAPAPETTGVPSPETTAAPAPETTGAPSEGKKGGTLRIAVTGSTNDIIDGQYIVAKPDQARLVLGWEPILCYDENFNISYEHALAESVEAVAADHYVIKLKSGITFHNGNPVTADDLAYSFTRRLQDDFPSTILRQFLDESGVTKVDDLTVDIKLKQPAVTFLNSLAEYTATVVPVGYKAFAGSVDDQIGTGPFMLKSFTPGAESVHVRYDGYWGGPALLDEVQVIDFADAAAAVNAFTSGQVDAICDLPYAQAEAVKADSNLTVLVSQAGSWLPITMAIDQAPFDDVRVRQAMRLIPDREQMVQQVLSGYGTVGNDMYGVLDGSYPKDFPQRTQDLEKAKALLEEAGQAGLTIDLFAPDDTAGLPEMAAAFAEMAKGAGVTVNVKVLDGGTYWGDQYLKYTFATSFWGTRPYLNQVAAGSLKDAVYPETHWPPADSDFATKYSTAVAETDQEKRFALIREMQQEEYDNGGNIIWGFNNLLDAHANYVVGLSARPNMLNLDHFGRGMKRVWLDV